MHFLAPLALLLSVPIGGIIVVMYILKLRRKDVVVSSTFLWRQVIRDVQANAPFQKLRKNLLLLLQLIVAALIIFALSQPFWRYFAVGGRNIVVIVDTSASMGAIDVKPSRIEEAKKKAFELVKNLQPGDQMMIISAYSRPQAVTGFTKEQAELNRAIDGIKPHDTPTNMREALNLAADLVASRNNGDSGRIELISDGGFETQSSGKTKIGGGLDYNLSNLNLGKTHVTCHPIGVRQNNVGIISVDFRRNINGDKSLQLLLVVHNYSSETKKFNAEIYGDQSLVDAHEITLPPNGEEVEPYDDIPEPDHPVKMRIKLDIQDDMAADNQAALIIKPRKTLKTLLVGKDNIFLESALKVDPGVQLEKSETFTSGKGYDVVIFNEAAPAKLPEGNYLFLHCSSDQAPVKVEGSVNQVSAADWEHDHPVTRYIDFGSERFVSAMKASTLGWGKELAIGDSGTLLAAGEKHKMRAVFVGFSLSENPYFQVRVAFPILISNSVRWLGTGNDDSEIGQVHTGEPVTIPAPPSAEKLTITKPSGAKSEIKVSERGGAVYDEADESGLYTAEGNGFTYPFAANLANANESDTTPHKELTITDNPTAVAGRRVADNWQLLPLLAAIALCILLYEWWVFHRRIHLN